MEAKNLPDALTLIKDQNGWTQDDLARELDLSQGMVSLLINGKRDLAIGKVIRLLSRIGWEVRIAPKAKENGPVQRRSFLTIAASVALVPAQKSTPYENPEFVRGLAERLSASYEQLGGIPLASTALRYVRHIQGAIGSRGHQLQEAAAELTRISSQVLYDAKQLDAATETGILALAFARRANFTQGTAWAYENLCMFTTSSDPTQAAHYARRGLEVPDLPREHLARLNARLATAASRDRRNAGSAERIARTALEIARSTEGLSVDTSAVVLGSSGLCNARLRRYKDAHLELANAVNMFDQRPLLSADWRAVQVTESLRAGDLSRAGDQMKALAHIVPLVTSAQVDRRMREILTFSSQWGHVPEIKSARDELRSVVAMDRHRTV